VAADLDLLAGGGWARPMSRLSVSERTLAPSFIMRVIMGRQWEARMTLPSWWPRGR
jgi:hypothetical protein